VLSCKKREIILEKHWEIFYGILFMRFLLVEFHACDKDNILVTHHHFADD